VLFLIEIFFRCQPIQSPPYALEWPLASASNGTIRAREKDPHIRATVKVAYYETPYLSKTRMPGAMQRLDKTFRL
jgi:hypothetical protein